MVSSFSDGEDVGWDFITPLSSVKIDSPHGVDGEPLVWIDSDTEQPGVSINEPLHVSLVQVEQYGCIVKIGEIGHVLTAIILGGIDLSDQILLELLDLLAGVDQDLDLPPSSLLDETLCELVHIVGNVAGSLGIVGFRFELPLDLRRDEEVWCWIRIIS